jgi:hypothetical protein
LILEFTLNRYRCFGVILPVTMTSRSPSDIAMNSVAHEYIKRATECVRIAEAENDDDVRIFLVNLASAWARAAAQEKAKTSRRNSAGATELRTIASLDQSAADV